jgi:hypothetical protein
MNNEPAEQAAIIDQALINRIVNRAIASNLGLSDAPKSELSFQNYSQQDIESLALILVDAYQSKYDLVSIFGAAMKEIELSAIQSATAADKKEIENHGKTLLDLDAMQKERDAALKCVGVLRENLEPSPQARRWVSKNFK